VTAQRARGPIVIDTNVFGADLVPGSPLIDRYEPLIVGRPAFVSFQTVAELHFGALRRGWGPARMLKLDAKIARAEVVHSGMDLVLTWAQLRADCERVGHALGQPEHDGDRWIAATALRLGVSLVSDDGIFRGVPSLVLETVRAG
jgi:predicted nucleic acid-binding protein